MINNDDVMAKVMNDISPKDLTLIPDKFNSREAPYLDMFLKLQDGVITTSIFDKRDAFSFPIINFPTLTGNIPLKSSYGVFVCELVRYARVCTLYTDFKDRVQILVKKLLKQFYTESGLRKTFYKFCDMHFLLIQKYGPQILDTW